MNLQHIEKSDLRADGSLDVVKIWHTIQGEGPYVGMPAVFIRLAGCNLQCPLCDTDYTSNRKRMSVAEVRKEIHLLATGMHKTNLVVFTGGEPLRQNLTPIVRDLHTNGFLIQLETNGTIYADNFPYKLTTIVCSPKTPQISQQLRHHISAYKYVICHGEMDPKDGLPTKALGGVFPARPHAVAESNIYIQPCDELDPVKNEMNMQQAVRSCMEFGYRLCLQIHKIAGLE